MPVRIQRRRTKGYKMPEGAIYVGRPTSCDSFLCGNQIYNGALQHVRTVLEHTKAAITGATKRASIFIRRVIMIPTQLTCSTTYRAFLSEKAALPISRLIKTGTPIGFWRTSECSKLISGRYFYWSARRTLSSPSNWIYFRETMTKHLCRAARTKISGPQFSVITGDAKTSRSGWFTAPYGGAELAIVFTWSRHHD